jgi:hypothetical protein
LICSGGITQLLLETCVALRHSRRIKERVEGVSSTGSGEAERSDVAPAPEPLGAPGRSAAGAVG